MLLCNLFLLTKEKFYFDQHHIKQRKGKEPRQEDDQYRFYFCSAVFHQSSTRFNLIVDTGETISGNFSITTLLGSRPKPLSSERLASLSQK